MFGFVMEFKPPFNDMAYIQLQYIAIDDYTDPNPKNITDDFPQPVNYYSCKSEGIVYPRRSHNLHLTYVTSKHHSCKEVIKMKNWSYFLYDFLLTF